jgi:hypothetical protein
VSWRQRLPTSPDQCSAMGHAPQQRLGCLIHFCNAGEVNRKLHLFRRQGRRARVLEPAHVLSTQPTADDHDGVGLPLRRSNSSHGCGSQQRAGLVVNRQHRPQDARAGRRRPLIVNVIDDTAKYCEVIIVVEVIQSPTRERTAALLSAQRTARLSRSFVPPAIPGPASAGRSATYVLPRRAHGCRNFRGHRR